MSVILVLSSSSFNSSGSSSQICKVKKLTCEAKMHPFLEHPRKAVYHGNRGLEKSNDLPVMLEPLDPQYQSSMR
jgi:hypothetical protein